MKRFAFALALCTLAVSCLAQDAEPKTSTGTTCLVDTDEIHALSIRLATLDDHQMLDQKHIEFILTEMVKMGSRVGSLPEPPVPGPGGDNQGSCLQGCVNVWWNSQWQCATGEACQFDPESQECRKCKDEANGELTMCWANCVNRCSWICWPFCCWAP